MLSERLNAWSQLFVADAQPRSMLLTTSRSMIADLISGSGEAAVLMQLNTGDFAPADDPSVTDSLSSLAARIEDARHQSIPFEPPLVPATAADSDDADLTLYLFANQCMRSLVAKAAGLQSAGQIQTNRKNSAAKHVVVGLLRPQSPGPDPE